LKQSTFELTETASEEVVMVSTKKLEWTTAYHMAVNFLTVAFKLPPMLNRINLPHFQACLHALRYFSESSKLLRFILKKIPEYAQDDFAVGSALFFYGVQCNISGLFDEAEEAFRSCLVRHIDLFINSRLRIIIMYDFPFHYLPSVNSMVTK
jgi:hypothetical protein